MIKSFLFKHLVLIVSSIVFLNLTFSCSENTKKIDLKLLNSNLKFVDLFEYPTGENLTKLDTIEKIYSRYLTNSDWVKSLNTIKFEIYNNTESKLFLTYRPLLIHKLESKYINSDRLKNFPSDIYFEITDSLGKDLEFIDKLYLGSNYDPSITQDSKKKQWSKDSISITNSKYKLYEDEQRLNSFKVVAPNEIITISTTLSLPIPIDYNDINDYNYGIPMYKDNAYKFKLHYVVNKKDIEENLPKVILDSLKKENIIIKDIFLSSNIIDIFPKQ